jgi:hypothetical protein
VEGRAIDKRMIDLGVWLLQAHARREMATPQFWAQFLTLSEDEQTAARYAFGKDNVYHARGRRQ